MKTLPFSKKVDSAFRHIRGPCCAALAAWFLAVALTANAQTNYSQVRVFGDPNAMAFSPYGNVVEGSDGAFYGVTAGGGVPGPGTVFKVNKDGTGFKVLHGFGGTASDGQIPRAALVKGLDGTLYGTTAQGGTNHPGSFFNGAGTLFRINPDGSGYSVLHHFGSAGDGAGPRAALILADDGLLYGTTYQGGTNATPVGGGTLFKMNTDGTGYTVLHYFGGVGDGKWPLGTLTEGSDQALYGTTTQGGTNSSGAVFTMQKDGSGYGVLHHFGATGDGAGPVAGLMEASDHLLYGATVTGGAHNVGSLFSISKPGDSYSIIWSFDDSSGNGVYIDAGLIQGQDGMLYGVAAQTNSSSYSGNVFAINKNGTGFKIVHNFGGAADSNSSPTSALLQTTDGTLYGMTQSGGTGAQGTGFKVNPDGSGYAILWIFSSTAGDAGGPYAGLTLATDGTLYGTASAGGSAAHGAVFKFNQDGSGYSLVFSFSSDTNGGYYPDAPLLMASDHVFYGTTASGAAPGQGNQGTVFKLNLDGSGHTVLHSFGVTPSDGLNPQSGLIEGSDGALFGTTTSGGSNGFSGGTLYRLQKDGGNYAVLHQFGSTNNHDGVGPTGGALIEASDHTLYGLTASGGSLGSSFTGGTLYKINKDGTGYSVVYSFGGAGNGSSPSAVIEGSDGAFYGETGSGSSIFKMNKDGSSYTVLYSFGTFPDGSVPRTLIEGGGNVLYGTTVSGGKYSSGTVFKLNKDGSGYMVLYNFGSSTTDGNQPSPGLVIGNNGDVFGTTQRGGFGLGTVYALRNGSTTPPVNISIQSGNGISVLFTGEALRLYEVQATDTFSPTAWVPIATNAAAADGSFVFTDADAPNHPVRFYRIRE